MTLGKQQEVSTLMTTDEMATRSREARIAAMGEAIEGEKVRDKSNCE